MGGNKINDWVEVTGARNPSEANDWQEITDWQEEPKEESFSPEESFGRAAVQGGTFGLRDEGAGFISSPLGGIKQAASYLGYDTKNDPDVAKYKAERDASRNLDKLAQKQNPGSYVAGGVAGAVGSSFIPGLGIARGVGALKGAAQAARLGALSGAGMSESEGLGDLAVDAGAGAVGGAAGFGIGKGIDVGLGALGGATGKIGKRATNWLDDFAERRAVKQAGAMLKDERGLRYQNRLNPLGKKLLDEKIVTPLSGIQKVVDSAEVKLQESGEKLGRVEEMMDKYYAAIAGNPKAPGVFRPGRAAKKIDALAAQIEKSPAYSKFAGAIRSMAQTLRDRGDDLSFSESGKIKREFDTLVKYDRGQTAPLELVKDVRKIISDEMDAAVEGVSKRIAKPLLQKWREQKESYGLLSKVVEMGQDKIARNDANRWLSPSDYATALAGGVIGTQTGDNNSFLGSGLVGLAGNRFARAYGNSLASTGARALSRAIRATPSAAATFGDELLNRGSSVITGRNLYSEDEKQKIKDYLSGKFSNRTPDMGRSSLPSYSGSGLENNQLGTSATIRDYLKAKNAPTDIYKTKGYMSPENDEASFEDYQREKKIQEERDNAEQEVDAVIDQLAGSGGTLSEEQTKGLMKKLYQLNSKAGQFDLDQEDLDFAIESRRRKLRGLPPPERNPNSGKALLSNPAGSGLEANLAATHRAAVNALGRKEPMGEPPVKDYSENYPPEEWPSGGYISQEELPPEKRDPRKLEAEKEIESTLDMLANDWDRIGPNEKRQALERLNQVNQTLGIKQLTGKELDEAIKSEIRTRTGDFSPDKEPTLRRGDMYDPLTVPNDEEGGDSLPDPMGQSDDAMDFYDSDDREPQSLEPSIPMQDKQEMIDSSIYEKMNNFVPAPKPKQDVFEKNQLYDKNIQKTPQDVIKKLYGSQYHAPLAAALARGDENFSASYYVMQQTDPGFREMMEDDYQ